MLKLEVFDPPMCCKSGICGSDIDPTLVTFASDLEWLKNNGINVIRYGLSLEPGAFVKNDSVKVTLGKEGNGCLPILVIGGKIASKSCYPSREKLAELCEIEYNEDEAPPVHREENCCCGVDCDCSNTPQIKRCGNFSENKEDLTGTRVDESYFYDTEHKNVIKRDKIKTILFIVILLTMTVLIFIWKSFMD